MWKSRIPCNITCIYVALTLLSCDTRLAKGGAARVDIEEDNDAALQDPIMTGSWEGAGR